MKDEDDGAPFRNSQKPIEIMLFKDGSLDELQDRAEQWLREQGESIQVVYGGYFATVHPVQGNLFQLPLKYENLIVIWYREV